ncbi:MAG TPA: ABC transporter permease [Streptosporangiaceae bacterium]|nr:ABC transporter permease [Streptosporangiaceae bacterium]
MSDLQLRQEPLRIVPTAVATRPWRALGGRASLHLVERHARVGRHLWLMILSGIGEPLFYLLSIGVGIGHLVGAVGGVSYTAYVAPALLATSSMNGAIYDSTFNVFFLIKYAKTYDAALATPMRAPDLALGQVLWAVIRSALYAFAFTGVMLAMGLFHSYWAIGVLPAAVLTGFAFAAAGMAATTFMRSWQDFEYVTLAIVPMFLFSTTFYPLSVYPRPVAILVQCTPLYQAVTLMRGLALGIVGPGLLWRTAYLAIMGLGGLYLAGRRVGRLLLT